MGPYAGSGGLADTISISALNPYNPFGIDLDAGSNFGWVTRRPIEVGPRTFEQNVDTWYLNMGVEGSFGSTRTYHWDVNFVSSENSADQTFQNGYNIGNVSLALGDPAVCAAVPNCAPLDLFGGQGRPFTPEMVNFIRATQIDSSSRLCSWHRRTSPATCSTSAIAPRALPWAPNIESTPVTSSRIRCARPACRRTPLRRRSLRTTTSTRCTPSSALPLLETLDLSAAVRWSDYSTFGSETTGKLGFRWQPIEALALRGTYSTGFRAPNLGELYGLTQFGATLSDPCGPVGAPPVVARFGRARPPRRWKPPAAHRAYRPGSSRPTRRSPPSPVATPDLQPETSDSFTVGIVHDATWAEGLREAPDLRGHVLQLSKSIDAIQARDIQALINACLAAGGTDPTLCSPFTRAGRRQPPAAAELPGQPGFHRDRRLRLQGRLAAVVTIPGAR